MGYFERRDLNEMNRELTRYVETSVGKKHLVFNSLPRPSNAIEWASSDNFLSPHDISIYDNRGQYYALREFFQCYCPACSSIRGKDVFKVSKEELLKDDLLVYDYGRGIEYCPKCGATKSQFTVEGLLKEYNTLLGVVGMRAGKTTLAGMIMTYMEALLIGHEDAKAYLSLSSAPFVELGCIAVSAEQAKDTIWAQYRTFRENSKWFKLLKVIMKDEGYEKDGTYEELDNMIKNDVVGIRVQSLSSSSASLVGRTRAMFIIDELGRFDTTDSKRSAKEVWRAGDHSLKTTRKVVSDRGLPPWLGALVAIGSPISIDDYSMRMLQNDDSKNIFKMKFSTWEFNTKYKESDFEGDYKRDPVAADRDFGAEPPGAEMPFFEDWNLICELVEDKGLNPMAQFTDTVRQEGQVTYVGKAILNINVDTNEWFIGCDAGRSKDTFSIVGCKRVWNGSSFSLFQGFGIHMLPNKKKRRYIDYTCVVPLIERICEKFKVVKICFDYWNSESIFQDLQKKGYPIEQFSMSALRVEDFFNFKNAVMDGKVKLLPKFYSEDSDPELMDSQTRLYWEMKRMNRSKDLKKVDHSINSTSDLFESLVNCWRMASNATFVRTDERVPLVGQVIQFPKYGRAGGGRGW